MQEIIVLVGFFVLFLGTKIINHLSAFRKTWHFPFRQLDNDLSFPMTNLLLIFTPRENPTEAKAFHFKLPPLLRLGMKPFVMMTQVIYGKVIFLCF